MTRTPLLVRIKRKREDDTPEDGFLLNDTYFVRQRTVRSTVSASVCHSNCEGASRTTAECASALHLSGKKEIAAHTNVEEERFVRRRSRLCVESIHQGVLTGILIPVPSRATENRCNQDDSHSLPPPSRVADAPESNMQRLRRKRLRSVLCDEYVPFRVLGNNVSEATVPTSPLERVENRQDDKLPVMSTSIKHTMIMNKQWIDPNNQEDMNEVVEVFLDLDKQKECDVSSSGDVFLLANTTGNSSVSCYSSTFADDEYELHEDYATNTHLYHDDWFDTEQPVTLDETDDSNDNEGYDYPDGDGCEIRTRKCANMRETIYDYSSTRRWRWASQKTDSDDYDVY